MTCKRRSGSSLLKGSPQINPTMYYQGGGNWTIRVESRIDGQTVGNRSLELFSLFFFLLSFFYLCSFILLYTIHCKRMYISVLTILSFR